MRMLVFGVAIGLTVGLGSSAGAQYISGGRFFDLSATEQLAYVAGVSDTLQTIVSMNDELGTGAMIEALRNADKCTDTMKLGALGDFAAHAVQATPTAVPSTATIAALSKCQAP